MPRTSTVTSLFALLITFSSRAMGEVSKAECIANYESGQRARKNSELTKAREAFKYCASPLCPSAMHDDCAGWLEDVEAAVPRRAFRVKNGQGELLSNVTVSVDDAEPQPLQGKPLEFEPGEHELTFECEGYGKVERRLVFRAGEQLEPLEVELPSVEVVESGAAPHDAPRRVPFREVSSPNWIPTLIGAGVGVLGTVSFTYFGLKARSLDHSLDECIPNCSAGQVREVRHQYTAANASLGIAAAGFLAAGVSWLLQPSSSRANASASGVRVSLRVGPVTSLMGQF